MRFTKIEITPLTGGVRNEVVRITFTSAAGASSVVAKRYSTRFRVVLAKSDRASLKRGRLEYETLRKLHPRLMAHDDMVVPKPLAYASELGTLFMEDRTLGCRGRYSEHPESLDLRGDVPARLGRGLRRIHALRITPDLKPRLRARIRLETLSFQLYYAHLSARVHRTSNWDTGVNRLLDASREAPVRFLQGDYCPKNVLLHEVPRPTVVDFEVAGPGDPAYDVGYMLAHFVIDRVARETSAEFLSRALHGFMAGYGKPSHDKGFFARAVGWCAVALLYRSHRLDFLLRRRNRALSSELADIGGRLMHHHSAIVDSRDLESAVEFVA